MGINNPGESLVPAHLEQGDKGRLHAPPISCLAFHNLEETEGIESPLLWEDKVAL